MVVYLENVLVVQSQVPQMGDMVLAHVKGRRVENLAGHEA